MPLHYFVGGVEKDGRESTPYITDRNGLPAFFIIYCRRCHRGLCTQVEAGGHFIAVDPCDCDADASPTEYPNKAAENLLDDRESA